MAARTKRPLHNDETRQKIQTSQLINRLSANAMGKLPSEMSPSQVKSAEILLRKALPDLASVEMTGENGGAISVVIKRVSPDGD